jgi:hypothetical protein
MKILLENLHVISKNKKIKRSINNYNHIKQMVNAYEDLDFNGSLFYYKGHVVHIYKYEQNGSEVMYFEYNKRKVFIDPKNISISSKTGNKHYNGTFDYGKHIERHIERPEHII